jgi:hypothetical protein
MTGMPDWEDVLVSFTARIKGTSDIFEATSEWGPKDTRKFDAHSIRDGASYSGQRFIGSLVPRESKFIYSKKIDATFKANELEGCEVAIKKFQYKPKTSTTSSSTQI